MGDTWPKIVDFQFLHKCEFNTTCGRAQSDLNEELFLLFGRVEHANASKCRKPEYLKVVCPNWRIWQIIQSCKFCKIMQAVSDFAPKSENFTKVSQKKVPSESYPVKVFPNLKVLRKFPKRESSLKVTLSKFPKRKSFAKVFAVGAGWLGMYRVSIKPSPPSQAPE